MPKALDRATDLLGADHALVAAFLDLSSEAVVAVDRTQKIVAYSKGAERMFGHSFEEAVGQPLTMLLPLSLASRHEQLVEEFAGSATPTRLMGNRGEISGRRKGGEEFSAEASIARLQLGGEGILVAVLRDITERKRAEEATDRSQQSRDLILSSAGEGIYGLDENGLTTFVNPAAAAMLGWKPEDLLGESQHRLIHHTKPDGTPYDRKECPIYAAFNDGAVHRVDDEVFWRKDGTSLPVEYVSTPIHDDERGLVGAVVTFRDITERKLAEEALAQAMSQLEALKDQLAAENAYLKEEVKLHHNFKEIVGGSSGLRHVLHKIEQVAETHATVLILGETGTGKEPVARAVHDLSPRRERPLVKVNCAALPASLIESEFFGHEKGAFTGALAKKVGRFALADGGTIFLDEIGDLPLELQAKLLRVLQEGEFDPVGSTKTVKVDVRVIAATNRNLQEAVSAGNFRSDLYYRLNVFPIAIPPLRERKEDIPALVELFVDKFNRSIGKDVSVISQRVMDTLQGYEWPGNIRELQNVIERAVILTQGQSLSLEEALEGVEAVGEETAGESLEDVERAHIRRVLEKCDWKVAGKKGAAQRLGLNPSTLRSRLEKLGIGKSKRNA